MQPVPLPFERWSEEGGHLPLTWICRDCEEDKLTLDSFSSSQRQKILRRKDARCDVCCERLRLGVQQRRVIKAVDKAAKAADKLVCRKLFDCPLCCGYNDYNKTHRLGPFHDA